MSIRLDRWLVERTGSSRTTVARWVRQGRVALSGVLVRDPGTRIAPDAAVELDGDALAERGPAIALFHKPTGVQATVGDPWGRPSLETAAAELLAAGLRPVGRLDADTDGLLLFARDGAVTQRLLHPRRAVPRVYAATVEPAPDPTALTAALAVGIATSGGLAVAEVREVDGDRVVLSVTQGRHRMVRRMLANAGHPVLALRRLAFGAFTLGALAPGAWRAPTDAELAWLDELLAR